MSPGPWWCPACGRAFPSTPDTNLGEPCCPRCGGALEEQGTGDDLAYLNDDVDPLGWGE